MKVITFANRKGGVGKTTLSTNVAYNLSLKGHKILFVDSDPQGNSGKAFGVEVKKLKYHLGHVLDNMDFSQGLIKYSDKLDLILSNNQLDILADKYKYQTTLLKIILERYEKDYDFCIIDVPPSELSTNKNAVVAADYIVVPIDVGQFSIDGVAQIKEDIKKDNLLHKKDTKLLGIAMNNSNTRTYLYKEVMEDLIENFGEEVIMNTIVRSNIKIKEAQYDRLPVMEYDEKCNGAIDLMALTDEILERIG